MTSHGQAYRNASVPAGLAKAIVAVVHEHPELGYRTLSDFVRHATTLLGTAAVEAILRDSLPPEYQRLLEGEP